MNVTEPKEDIQSVRMGRGRKQVRKSRQQPNKSKKQFCKRCGGNDHHQADRQFPAKTKSCRKCCYEGHFAKMCRTQKSKYNEKPNNVTDAVSPDQGEYSFHVNEETALKVNDGEIAVEIGGVMVETALKDSRATSCYMSHETWNFLMKKKVKGISSTKLTPEERPAYAYMTSQRLDVIGKFEAEVKCPFTGRANVTEFVVIRGKKTCIDLNILRVGPPPEEQHTAYPVKEKPVEKEFTDVIRRVGKLKDYKLKIHVNTDIKPIAQPVR